MGFVIVYLVCSPASDYALKQSTCASFALHSDRVPQYPHYIHWARSQHCNVVSSELEPLAHFYHKQNLGPHRGARNAQRTHSNEPADRSTDVTLELDKKVSGITGRAWLPASCASVNDPPACLPPQPSPRTSRHQQHRQE